MDICVKNYKTINAKLPEIVYKKERWKWSLSIFMRAVILVVYTAGGLPGKRTKKNLEVFKKHTK